ncbi:MAG TPA: DUF4198 domain-containing protein [Urbifossiella sp.]|jgi:hypothetical protein|nr:DUF4198 domain-containing protein [Urbifossiella sp.]
MKRLLVAVLVGLVAAAGVRAHFAFILPEADGNAAKVVFSDELAPDAAVNIEKLANTKLTLRDAAGKDSPLEWKKGEGFYLVNLPGGGPRVVYGVTEYGVLQKGDTHPFRLTYYPKALIGDVPAAKAVVGGPLVVEIVPSGGAGTTRFQVLHQGKAAADVEATVLVPGGEKKAVKTDKGGFTPEFAPSGRYGVTARVTDAKAGEYAGKAFAESRHYATLVVDVK